MINYFILITDLFRCSWQFCGLPPSILCIETSLNAGSDPGISAPISLYNAVEEQSFSSPLNSSQTPSPSSFRILQHSRGPKPPGKSVLAVARAFFSPPGGPHCISSASYLILARRERLIPLASRLLFCTVAGADPWPLHMIVLYQQPYPLEHGFGSLWWIAWKMILISLCHLNFRTKGIISFAAHFDLFPFKLYFSCAAGPFLSEDHLSSIWTWFSGFTTQRQSSFPIHSFLFLLTFYIKEIVHLHQIYCMFLTFAISFLCSPT